MAELPPSDVGSEEARDLARDVLAGRAYAEARRGPSLRERVFNWFAEQIGDLFGALSSAGGRGFTAWIVIAVFAALIAFLLSKLLQGRGTLPKRQAAPKPTIDVLAGYTATEWLTQAETAEAAGDWRQGLRCRHRSLAASLVGKGLIADRPGLTAGEIQRLVAAERPEVDQPMGDATNLFKDTWYGRIPANQKTNSRFESLTTEVMAQLDRSESRESEHPEPELAAP